MKLKIAFLLFFCSLGLFAQGEEFVNEKVKSYYIKEDGSIIHYGTFEEYLLFKNFDSKSKVVLKSSNVYYSTNKISDSLFNSYSPKEFFFNALNHPENYFQSCSRSATHFNLFQKIPSELLLDSFSGMNYSLSKRQKKKIREQRTEIISVIKDYLFEKSYINNRFKNFITSFHLYEIIPELIKILNNQTDVKDSYHVTVLCLLLQDYKPFKESQIYKDLYVIDDSVEFNKRTLRDRTIPFTWKNYNQIVKFAEDYYQFKISNKN